MNSGFAVYSNGLAAKTCAVCCYRMSLDEMDNWFHSHGYSLNVEEITRERKFICKLVNTPELLWLDLDNVEGNCCRGHWYPKIMVATSSPIDYSSGKHVCPNCGSLTNASNYCCNCGQKLICVVQEQEQEQEVDIVC